MMIPAFQDTASQNSAMKQYYKFQSKIYDSTRWLFLFGRSNIIHHLPIAQDANIRILEVGCGTGYNLDNFANYFKNAHFVGIDVSEEMIALSAKKTEPFKDRVELLCKPYSAAVFPQKEQFDVVLFSYALTMINPQWEQLLEQAYQDIKPGGLIAVVDFHDTPNKLFKAHMKNNHVRMDSHLVPVLEEKFSTLSCDIQDAYLGAWQYFTFVGIKPYYK